MFEMPMDESFCIPHVSHRNGKFRGAEKRMRTKEKSEECDPTTAEDQRERVEVTPALKQQSVDKAKTRKQGTKIGKTHEGKIY